MLHAGLADRVWGGSPRLIAACGTVLAGVLIEWRQFRAVAQRSGVSDWRIHDIRRTVATGLQKLGVRFEVTEAALSR